MIEIAGYISAVIIGISLGLIGGGGSILTVPVLVYLLGTSPIMATAYSLFIVGGSSLIGVIDYARKKLVDYKTALAFGLPSLVAVFLTRKFLVPAIPNELFSLGAFTMTKGMFLMVLFALLMLFASIGMIKKKKNKVDHKPKTLEPWQTLLIVLTEGFIVGTLTGLVGAGGGFLIIPALVLFAGLEMKKAIGTSLLIIAVKSLVGFLGDVSNYAIDWNFLLLFTALAVVGIFIGSFLSTKIDGQKLKVGFGWFVLVMGAFILLKELF